MEPALRVGDLVTPVRVTPAFREKHGFGVVTDITRKCKETRSTQLTSKVRKVPETFRFSFDAVRRYGQD